MKRKLSGIGKPTGSVAGDNFGGFVYKPGEEIPHRMTVAELRAAAAERKANKKESA